MLGDELRPFVAELHHCCSHDGERVRNRPGRSVMLHGSAGISERRVAQVMNQFGEPIMRCLGGGGREVRERSERCVRERSGPRGRAGDRCVGERVTGERGTEGNHGWTSVRLGEWLRQATDHSAHNLSDFWVERPTARWGRLPTWVHRSKSVASFQKSSEIVQQLG